MRGRRPDTFVGGDQFSLLLSDGIGNAPISATQLPTALPLFASGLSALGVLGWRKKRRAPASGMSVLACFPSMRGQQYFVGATDDCK
jgi:hypothetical protein